CATHDHLNEYLTTTTPWDAGNTGRSKTNLDSYYQATVTAMESIGLTPDTTLATFATNKVGVNWFELGSPETSHKSSVDDLTVQAGYGFIAMRCSALNTDSYPKSFIPNAAAAKVPNHFLKSRTKHRGIAVLVGRDGGITNSNGNSYDKNAFNSTGQGFEALNNGTMIYYHHDDFEDVTVQPSGTSTGGLNDTFGLLTWQVMADYAAMCPNTVDFGADVNNYIF
ncbi:MAG: hypothetical protein ABUK13_02690, partial [Gammaproteobacteria bacterium]